MSEKACKTCRRLVKGNICPICKSTELTSSWKGIVVVINTDSEIAKEAGITAPGKYVSKIK